MPIDDDGGGAGSELEGDRPPFRRDDHALDAEDCGSGPGRVAGLPQAAIGFLDMEAKIGDRLRSHGQPKRVRHS